ncbi:hypothetical protein Tco_1327815 [Tanacetum coccineum]
MTCWHEISAFLWVGVMGGRGRVWGGRRGSRSGREPSGGFRAEECRLCCGEVGGWIRVGGRGEKQIVQGEGGESVSGRGSGQGGESIKIRGAFRYGGERRWSGERYGWGERTMIESAGVVRVAGWRAMGRGAGGGGGRGMLGRGMEGVVAWGNWAEEGRYVLEAGVGEVGGRAWRGGKGMGRKEWGGGGGDLGDDGGGGWSGVRGMTICRDLWGGGGERPGGAGGRERGDEVEGGMGGGTVFGIFGVGWCYEDVLWG